MLKGFLFFVICVISFFNPITIGAQTVTPDALIIKFKDGTTEIAKQRIYSQTQTTRTNFLSAINIETVNFTGNLNQIVTDLNTYAEVEYAEPDYYRNFSFTPNDPSYASQYHLPIISANTAWDITKGLATVYVADIDTGISTNHPDLINKIYKTHNLTNSGMTDSECPHGSSVAGVFGAETNNSLGVSSVGFNIKIIAVKISATNKCSPTVSKIAEGIRWAVDNGAQVINISGGSPQKSETERLAIEYAWGKNVLVIASAGNEGTTIPNYPANYPNVVSVAATNQSDKKAGFSTYGSWVDIAAPGVGILTTAYNGGNTYQKLDGTSFSAPIVAGVAALIKSKNPNLTNTQISDILCNTADKIQGTGTNWRCGRVNAEAAVKAAGGGGSPTPTPSSTPSPSPSPTGSPAPTSTPSANDLIIKTRFQGIDVTANSQPITTNIYQNGTLKITTTQEATSNSNGTYNVRLTNPQNALIPGTVAIKIKGPSHLQKSVPSVIYTGPGTTIDLTQSESQILLAGDTTNDNKITIEDISNISRYYTDFSVAVDNNDTSMKSADITKDGTITIQDLALASINWSDLTVVGDQ